MVGGEDEVLRVTIDEDLVFPKEVNGNEEVREGGGRRVLSNR